MARIAGINIPLNKRVEIGLTYIYGIGRPTSNEILAQLGIEQDRKVRDLVVREVSHVCVRADAELRQHLVGGGPPDPVDVGQTDLDALVQRDVDAGDTSHGATPAAACGAGSSR